MNMKHRHRTVSSTISGFSGPVAWPENRAAHGCIRRVDTCRCGAKRSTNINQQHIEKGEWKITDESISR